MKIRVLGPSKSFIVRDVALLREMGHDAIHVLFENRGDIAREAFHRRDLTVHWLCGYGAGVWARLPPVIRGRNIGVFGGGEVYPENLKDPSFEMHIRRVLKRFEGIAFVAPHLLEMAARQGLPIPRNLAVCPTYADPEVFRPVDKRSRTAAICGPFLQESRVFHKGLDRLPAVAKKNPDWRFYVVGLAPHLNRYVERLDNVIALPPESDIGAAEKRWSRLAGETAIVLCLSRWEGLPTSLIEGMLAGCVPVVTTDVPSVGWAVGESGLILREGAPVDLNVVREDGALARDRALRLFSKSGRMQMWRRMIDRVMSATPV